MALAAPGIRYRSGKKLGIERRSLMKRRHIKNSVILGIALLVFCNPLVRSAADQTYENMKMLVEVLNLIKDNYVEEIEPRKVVYGAAAGMVRVLDPFSQFLE